MCSVEMVLRCAAPQPERRVREYMAAEVERALRQSAWAYWFEAKPTLAQELLFYTRGELLLGYYPDTRLDVEVLHMDRSMVPLATVMWAVIPGLRVYRRGMLINGPLAKAFFSRAA